MCPIYYYEANLTPAFTQIEGMSYWVSIQAISNNPAVPFNAEWRWQEANRWFYPIKCGAASFVPGSQWMTIFWNWPEPGQYSDMAFVLTSVVTKTLNLKFYLEGLYDGDGIMRKAQDESGDHFPGITADQVQVELHNAADYSLIEYTAHDVNLSTMGNLTTSIPDAFNGAYYVTIRHRNSIETTTALPVPFAGSVIDYDYSIAASQAYGDNMSNWYGTGVYVIYGADVSQD